jgi:hypothetical protein
MSKIQQRRTRVFYGPPNAEDSLSFLVPVEIPMRLPLAACSR